MFRSNSFVCAVLLVIQACGSEDPSDATVPEWGGAPPAAPIGPLAPEATRENPANPAAPSVNGAAANEGTVPVANLSPSSEAPGNADEGNADEGNTDEGNTDEGNTDEGNTDGTEQPPATDATPPLAPPVDGEVLAFPGAQGFGRFAVGARGRDVVHVTNLNDSGPGSLRDAVSQANRTVVFEVGGVINLASRLIFKNNQTIAGQTAPGGGITLYGDGTSFSGASDTIVRYVRFRMGRTGTSASDTVTMANGHDVIWDHVSLSWGRDGNFDLNVSSGAALYNLTLQDSIVAQGLQTHSTGGLVQTTGTSIIRSLYIDNNSRNPKARGTLQFVNNVIYNWVVSGYILGDTAGRSDGYMAGNYFISGPESNGGTLDSPTPQYNLFATDNFYDSDRNGTLNGRVLSQGDFGSVTWQAAPSVPFPEVPAMPALEAFEYVSTHAGASIFRDAADDYVVSELHSFGTRGKTISDEVSLGLPNVVGNLPTAATRPDLDRDGMADAWERANGLDPNDVNDRNGDRNGDGWTNLEEYVNSLAP